jgi:predicted ATP-grasp superfamily ATP-dependent carboligase
VFLWSDPERKNDLLVFLGEGQPPSGKYAFCRELVKYARSVGVERVFTFAAMATGMRPGDDARVFTAATDEETLRYLRQFQLEVLEEGQIGGLNGLLLGLAAEDGLSGACLLGEMPHLFVQLPNPKASLAILEVFTEMTGIDVDLAELAEQAGDVDRQLGELLGRMESQIRGRAEDDDEEPEFAPGPLTDEPDPAVSRRIERLFQQALADRSKAFELKQELDKSGRFKEYEDRFLDLFRKADGPK